MPAAMSWEVAVASVELLARLSEEWQCPGFINFTGGEPLLRFDFLRELVDHTAHVASSRGIPLRCSFGITNGTVLPDGMIEFLQRTNHVVSVSLDGPEELHNANRRFPGGEGLTE